MGPGLPRHLLVAAALLTGCQTMLELEPPVFRPDAAIDASEDGASATADARECPPAPAGCTVFRCAWSTSCYYACSGAASWSAAQSQCSQVGCLATIDADAEQQCLVAATGPSNASPVWIGAHQDATAAEPSQGWTWACGASAYRDWASFEPYDLSGDQDCAQLTSGGHWSDTSCAYERRFVCESP